jgi:hypothetical protein
MTRPRKGRVARLAEVKNSRKIEAPRVRSDAHAVLAVLAVFAVETGVFIGAAARARGGQGGKPRAVNSLGPRLMCDRPRGALLLLRREVGACLGRLARLMEKKLIAIGRFGF